MMQSDAHPVVMAPNSQCFLNSLKMIPSFLNGILHFCSANFVLYDYVPPIRFRSLLHFQQFLQRPPLMLFSQQFFGITENALEASYFSRKKREGAEPPRIPSHLTYSFQFSYVTVEKVISSIGQCYFRKILNTTYTSLL